MTWILQNLPWLLGSIAVPIVATLITAFTNYPRTEGVLQTIQRILGLISIWGHADSPGAKLKAPLLMAPNVPADHPMMMAAALQLTAQKKITKPGGTALVLILALGVAAHAKADTVIASGPTIPIVELRLADPATGKSATALLQAGAGYALNFGFAQQAIGGKAFDLLDLSLAAFAQIGSEAGQNLDAASIAFTIGTLNNLISLGFGIDLIQVYGSTTTGVFAGNVGKQNLFGLLSLSFQFGTVSSPPVGVSEGAMGLPRGNQVAVF